MTWLPWIKIEPIDTDSEVVQALYQRTRDRVKGCPPDTVRLTSLTPQVSGLLIDLNKAIYQEARGLSTREKEITALIVAVLNGCVHWTASHLATLGRVAHDEQFAAQVKDDFTKADLSVRERRMADFTVKVTRAPNTCSPADIQQLREVELSDSDILSLVEIISYYNFSTRLFEALSTIDPDGPASG